MASTKSTQQNDLAERSRLINSLNNLANAFYHEDIPLPLNPHFNVPCLSMEEAEAEAKRLKFTSYKTYPTGKHIIHEWTRIFGSIVVGVIFIATKEE